MWMFAALVREIVTGDWDPMPGSVVLRFRRSMFTIIIAGIDSAVIDRDLPTGALVPTLPECKSIPASVRGLIVECWRVSPNERPTAQQIHQQCEAELAALAGDAAAPAPAPIAAIELLIAALRLQLCLLTLLQVLLRRLPRSSF